MLILYVQIQAPVDFRVSTYSYPVCLVDKKLLETPDDEIDERRIPIKDLILLSEARERMSVSLHVYKTFYFYVLNI